MALRTEVPAHFAKNKAAPRGALSMPSA